MLNYDLVVVGGGPAGMFAAITAAAGGQAGQHAHCQNESKKLFHDGFVPFRMILHMRFAFSPGKTANRRLEPGALLYFTPLF